MRTRQIDQTLSFSDAVAASTVRELILPSGISFQGLKFSFMDFTASSAGTVSAGINSLRIQVVGQSPVNEVVLIESQDDIDDYLGLLVTGPAFGDINNMQNMGVALSGAATTVDDVRSFIFPWAHCNETQVKVIIDWNSVAAATTTTVRVDFVNPGMAVPNTAVLNKFAIPAGSVTNALPLPAWGCDEFVLVPSVENSISQIQQTALGLQINNAKTLRGDWEWYTGQGQPADSKFFNYYLGRTLVPQQGASDINITKTDAAVTGFVRYLKVVPCARGA